MVSWPAVWADSTSSSLWARGMHSTCSTCGPQTAETKPGSDRLRQTPSTFARASAADSMNRSERTWTPQSGPHTPNSPIRCWPMSPKRMAENTRVATIMRRWVQGSLGEMFSAPTNVDLDNPVVVFGMRELRDEMVAPTHFLLAEALWTRIKRKDRRRMLIVDELGLLFEDPTIRRFVVSLARRIRKYEGSLVFATQNPGDLLSSEQGSVVATNPALLFLGAQRPGEAAKLQSTFRLSTSQRGFLETARRGEFLLSAGPARLAVDVQAPPWQEETMRLARAAARPPPRRLGLAESASGPALPHRRPSRATARAASRAVRGPWQGARPGAPASPGWQARARAGYSRWSSFATSRGRKART